MDFDVKTLIIGLLLGIISGIGFANVLNIDWWEELSALGSFLGGIAAIGALFVGLRALNSWRQQSDYSNILQKLDGDLKEAYERYTDTVSLFLTNTQTNKNEQKNKGKHTIKLYVYFDIERARFISELKEVKDFLRGKEVESLNELLYQVSSIDDLSFSEQVIERFQDFSNGEEISDCSNSDINECRVKLDSAFEKLKSEIIRAF